MDADVAPAPLRRAAWRRPALLFACAVLAAMAFVALAAPWLGTVDPRAIDPGARNRPPGYVSEQRADDGRVVRVVHRMGTDSLGRDVYSRTLYGARVSLAVGASVAIVALAIGLVLGLVAGWNRWIDAVLMRVMDGLMAIPAVLLALAVVALTHAGLVAVIVAIVLPEIPRTTRLVRAVVLATRPEPYVDAALALGASPARVLARHVAPAAFGPLAVHGSYVAASAILIEAILSFLGVGLSPETPSWGNVMADGRALFRLYPHTILFPGALVALTVLAVNVLGDALAERWQQPGSADYSTT
ncbi:MAG: ABC transporter permease [Proteobacteria bacterium]|nr:ABC transporter permease [Pseudomonadota bacterium]